MSGEKFTTGEWEIIHFSGGMFMPEQFMIHNQQYGEIAVVNFHGESDGTTEKANATFIATAPEMYRLLEQLYETLKSVPVLQKEIEAVLRKARGEE